MNLKFISSLIILATLLHTAVFAAGQDAYIINSVLEISSTVQKEFYAGISEKTMFSGAAAEISKKYDTGGRRQIATRQEFAAFLSEMMSGNRQAKGDIGELAVKGMIKSLNDPYSLFLDTKQWEYFKRVSSGEEFTGIGVELAKKNGLFTIVSPVEGGSAAKAGIQPGDIIVKAEGRNLSGMDDLDALALFDGHEGSVMRLSVRRGNSIRDFAVKRTALSLKDPVASIVKSGARAGYLKISYFSEKTDRQASALLDKIRAAGIKNLIIDLRNNPGGDLNSSLRLASMFMGRKTIVTKVKSGGQKSQEKGQGDAVYSFNTVILVNRGTASASEVFSGAMQDYGLAKLAGETTFGKALIQSVYSLPGNAGCKITTARYYTAKGRDILYKGLAPEIKAGDCLPKAKASEDPCVKAALKYFASKQG